MAGMSKEAHAAKRAARLKAIEAAKPEDERLLQREWDDHVVKLVSVQKLHDFELVKHQVVTTFCLDEVRICETEEEAERYFAPGGTPWTVSVLKRFLEAYILSAEGHIQMELSIYGVANKLFSLFSSASRHGNPVDKMVKRNITVWLHTDLMVRGLVHDNRLPKPTPIPSDITTLLGKFFQPEYLVATVLTTRTVLNVVLTLCLMLDCNSRISELLDATEVPTHLRAAHTKENEDKIFAWKRVEVFVFRKAEQSPVELQARVTFKKLKKKRTVRGNRQKTIPLRLLPLHLASEDTLRWLVILGLMDGVFQGVDKWEDFDDVGFAPEGVKIPIKPEFLDTPVLRTHSWRISRHDAALIRMTANNFRRELAMLSRYGLEYKLLPGCLRRTSAYVLALHASDEDRCARMGHSDSDKTYFGAYRNTTSTIDFQAMRLGIPAAPVENMSSITLNRLQEPPKTVSAAGQLEVAQDPELVSNLQEQCDLTDQIVVKYGSADAVRPCDDDLLAGLARLKRRYAEKEAYLMRRKFESEWKAHFERRNEELRPSEVPDTSIEQTSNMTSDVENLILVLEQQDEQLQRELQNIDPAHLEDLEAENDEESVRDDFGEEVNLDDIQFVPSDAEDSDNDEETPNLRSRKKKYRFSFRPVGKYSLLHGATELLYNQAPDLTPAALADRFVDMFNHGHVADRFYPNQEPLSGTMDCRFCGDPLARTADSAKHAYHCEVITTERQIFERLERDQVNKTVPKTCGQERADKPGRDCIFEFLPGKNATGKPAHLYGGHARRYHFDRTTSEYVCKSHAFSFSSFADYRIHMIEAHDVPVALLQDGVKILGGSLTFWCKICQVHVHRDEATEDDHFASHLTEVNEAMQPFGLVGYDFSHQWLHPSFCPFCIFDKNAPLGERMFFYQMKSRFMTHVDSHLKKLEDSVYHACPAAKDSGDGVQAICDHTTPMSKAALRQHFVKDHGMIFNYAKAKKTPSRAKSAVQKKDQKDTDEDEEIEAEGGKTEEESEDSEAPAPPRKKAKVGKKTPENLERRPLQTKDANRK